MSMQLVQQRRLHDRSNQKHKQESDIERKPFNRRTANSSPSAPRQSTPRDKKPACPVRSVSSATGVVVRAQPCMNNCPCLLPSPRIRVVSAPELQVLSVFPCAGVRSLVPSLELRAHLYNSFLVPGTLRSASGVKHCAVSTLPSSPLGRFLRVVLFRPQEPSWMICSSWAASGR